MSIRSSLQTVPAYGVMMDHAWFPLTVENLREQSSKLRRLAAHVRDRDLHDRLLAEALALERNADATMPTR